MGDTKMLRWLADRAEISDVVTRFVVSLDMRDWDRFLSCLADEIYLDYPDSVGVATFSAEDLVQTASRFFGRLDATQHISANHQITIDGDSATCVSTLLAQHYLSTGTEGPVQRQIGYYQNDLERLDGWRIVRSQQRVWWNEGSEQVFLHAAAAFS